jgi:hypothetical protein
MFAIVAVVIFGLMLILDLANKNLGDPFGAGTLMIAGFLCIALHMAGVGTAWRGFGRRGRR